MTLYIILIFSAICVGMAISVKAFGTGGKRKRIFQDIYFSIEEVDGIGVLYTKTGEYSAVLKIPPTSRPTMSSPTSSPPLPRPWAKAMRCTSRTCL